jgi:hypothetical protein
MKTAFSRAVCNEVINTAILREKTEFFGVLYGCAPKINTQKRKGGIAGFVSGQ